jgi:peptidoglycan/xylan/chitin deacetylase (PgdA/CDA1 family)
MSASAQIRRLALPLFGPAFSRRAALRIAARRGRSLVLLYHRVLPDGVAPEAIVPSLPLSLFRRQLEAVLRFCDIVPLPQLFESSSHSRPRIAVTFDDDDAGYVDTLVPTLRALGVPATFFLSGRSLHGLPPYWWSTVEHSLRTHGFDSTRRALGVEAGTLADLVIALERSPQAARLANRLPPISEPQMTGDHIRTLAVAGMTIGFHTLHHPRLTMITGRALEAALIDGRQALAAAAGSTIDQLAYPHGRASASVAEAVERANYAAAFTAGGRPVHVTSDRFLLDRWEPGPLDADMFCAHLAMRLLRPPTRPRSLRRKRAAQTMVTTDVND